MEARWQRAWEVAGLYRADLDAARRPFYNLMEFPYPSGEGLHVGHFYSYSGADTYGRFQRMRGHDVFQPMGFDAFGIHAENYALKLGINPAVVVPRNVARFREQQLKRMGAAYDWSRELATTDPAYYRWTQWIFVQLYAGGLAYRAQAPVTWCPSCLTTLADEQVVEGRCERCDTPVTRRVLGQWFLRITDYAERLLDFSGADFPETTVRLQSHWIGRKEGAEVDFAVEGGTPLAVFTTRIETLYGATFLVLAPEHSRTVALCSAEQRPAVEAYLRSAANRSELERLKGTAVPQTAAEAEKTGVWTGAWARHPLDGRRLPIWVADYVLPQHGSGAIYGVPAHDVRDHAFARAHGLPMIQVVRPTAGDVASGEAYEGDGLLVHSGPYDGLALAEARVALVRELQARGVGRPVVAYRLHDWLISRQRYWGPPIPMVYCERCGQQPVPARDLPVLLPATESFRPLGTGESPLAAIPEFVVTSCPCCGGPARRETDVSDNFLDSAWYYLRYLCTECHDRPWDVERLRRWLPVRTYIGGIEHSTLHHLYARFIWKALQDLGHIPMEIGPEPFTRLRLHGLIIKDGRRMSKSRGNVVNPDEYVERYGADVLRLYLLFMGPFEEGGDYSDAGIAGVVRFLNRVWRLAACEGAGDSGEGPANNELLRATHRTVRAVSGDLERMAFNTAIATLMAFANQLQARQGAVSSAVWEQAVRTLILLLAPLAPHLAEELWMQRGGPFSVHQQAWPTWDAALVADETLALAVQVDGRVRDRIQVPSSAGEDEVRALALAAERIAPWLAGRTIQRVVVVPDKLVNIVTG